jgi:hypothetical protein
MIQGSSRTLRKEYVAKVVLISIFLGGFALFTGWMLFFGPGLNLFKLSAMQLVLLVFSTYRLGRLVAYDRVMEPFRQFFTNTVPDSTGAGDSVDPKGEGFQQAIGQLICCPICAGTWVAALLTYALYLFPGPAMVFLTMTAAIGGAELLGALTEALSWTGQLTRTMSGAKMMERTLPPTSANGYEEQGQPIEFPDKNDKRQAEPVGQTYRDYHRDYR